MRNIDLDAPDRFSGHLLPFSLLESALLRKFLAEVRGIKSKSMQALVGHANFVNANLTAVNNSQLEAGVVTSPPGHLGALVPSQSLD
jgi:hypothetical protein